MGAPGPVYLTRVLTRIIRRGASGSRSPPKAFSKVLPPLCTAAFLRLLRRRIAMIVVDLVILYLARAKRGRSKEMMVEEGEQWNEPSLVPSLSNSRTEKLEISIGREQRVVEMKGVA